jgi:hypothetical protein
MAMPGEPAANSSPAIASTVRRAAERCAPSRIRGLTCDSPPAGRNDFAISLPGSARETKIAFIRGDMLNGGRILGTRRSPGAAGQRLAFHEISQYRGSPRGGYLILDRSSKLRRERGGKRGRHQDRHARVGHRPGHPGFPGVHPIWRQPATLASIGRPTPAPRRSRLGNIMMS